jgi:hypothetical protein
VSEKQAVRLEVLDDFLPACFARLDPTAVDANGKRFLNFAEVPMGLVEIGQSLLEFRLCLPQRLQVFLVFVHQ